MNREEIYAADTRNEEMIAILDRIEKSYRLSIEEERIIDNAIGFIQAHKRSSEKIASLESELAIFKEPHPMSEEPELVWRTFKEELPTSSPFALWDLEFGISMCTRGSKRYPLYIDEGTVRERRGVTNNHLVDWVVGSDIDRWAYIKRGKDD